MSPLVLDVTPGDRTAFVRTFVLDGVSVRMRLRWLDVVARWLLELLGEDEQPLALPHLVTGGSEVLYDRRDPRLPPGRLVWLGEDAYARLDLGVSIRLLYVPARPAARIDLNRLPGVAP